MSSFCPMLGVVGGNDFFIIGDKKIDLEDAVTELIIKEKGFMGVGVGVTVDATESMSDVRVIFDPRVVKIVRGVVTRNIRGRNVRFDIGVSAILT